MIKHLLLLLSFLILSAAEDLSTKSPMLWEISGGTLEKPSYLFGTFHSRDPDINMLHPSVLSVLDRSNRLYTEITMNNKSSMEVLTFIKLQDPILLEERLQPKTLELLLIYIKTSRSELNLKKLSYFKTWGIALMIGNEEERNDPHALFMDERLVEYAKKQQIAQAGLETVSEQLSYFENLSNMEQEQLLLDTLDQEENTNYKEALKSWYQKGCAKGFFALQKRFASNDPKQQQLDKKLIEGLLAERNSRFTERIGLLFQKKFPHTYFFAIGAGHLSGEEGLLIRLEQLGYRVKKVN